MKISKQPSSPHLARFIIPIRVLRLVSISFLLFLLVLGSAYAATIEEPSSSVANRDRPKWAVDAAVTALYGREISGHSFLGENDRSSFIGNIVVLDTPARWSATLDLGPLSPQNSNLPTVVSVDDAAILSVARNIAHSYWLRGVAGAAGDGHFREAGVYLYRPSSENENLRLWQFGYARVTARDLDLIAHTTIDEVKLELAFGEDGLFPLPSLPGHTNLEVFFARQKRQTEFSLSSILDFPSSSFEREDLTEVEGDLNWSNEDGLLQLGADVILYYSSNDQTITVPSGQFRPAQAQEWDKQAAYTFRSYLGALSPAMEGYTVSYTYLTDDYQPPARRWGFSYVGGELNQIEWSYDIGVLSQAGELSVSVSVTLEGGWPPTRETRPL